MEKSWEKPSDPGTVQSLAVCERWRKRVCEDLDNKLERLYHEALPEAETRYLNDEVNQIIRELRRWEIRIVELGGIDYSRVSHQTPTGDMLNTAANHYQYFGRARNLPGVKELIEAERRQRIEASTSARRIGRDALLQRVDGEYYGLCDDAQLERDEIDCEKAVGAFHSEPLLETGRVPTDDEVRDALDKMLSGQCTEIIV
jgi:pre-mRNA-splicing factor ISY1